MVDMFTYLSDVNRNHIYNAIFGLKN